ncbi:TonB-dependent receptor [Alteromonas gilva]|uniref:TonB-dependent receptor n=1 Tax=Alteromonas gilva TaxID=2987522 RepID=A0ABT5L1C6_9ALTE|nr:TonB-dependent receptor [Alteromonas gilva]MDC8830196.1 TonB-dependent receptor [Alteromonas gilva]
MNLLSNNTRSFTRSTLALCIIASMHQGVAIAQEAEEGAVPSDAEIEVINVSGIRGSQEASIFNKRNASTVVDSIAATDIGKLPDVTISDSLQRISGVQIRRSAGEGASLNIRGLPQVVTQLNGEQYLGANSVVSTQPNFSDIPSPLFRGADVFKNATANLGNAGITGTVNLKTYRPFDFDEGSTFSGAAEVQRGDETRESDPNLSALYNWQNGDVGFMLSGNYANVNLANYYNGLNTGSPGDAGWTDRTSAADIGAPGRDGRVILGAQGFSAWNQATERERIGINSSTQVDLGEGFVFTADFFYTEQEEYNRKLGMSATNKWGPRGWFTPTEERPTGAMIDGGEMYAWQSAELYPSRLKSFTQNDVYNNRSTNLNLQLDYDNGGAFSGQFRAIIGRASQEHRHGYNEGDLTNGQTTLGRTTNLIPADKCGPDDEVVGDQGGCLQAINPLGYSEAPHLSYDTTGEHPVWSGFDRQLAGGLGAGATIADYMGNLASYNVGAFSSENNENAEGDVNAFSMKGKYLFDSGNITSLEAGIRYGQRGADYERYHLFSPVQTAGCMAQWKATDVLLGADAPSCSDGEMVNGEFMPYAALESIPLDQYNNVVQVTDYGPVSGIPGAWAVDPADYDDPEAFHNRVFGSSTRQIVPGSSFSADVAELSYFLQVNFEGLDGLLSGNAGVRVIETDLTVKQNIAGDNLPYSGTAIDTGDVLTKRDYTDVLPSLNLSYSVTDDVVVRFAYSENMTPLNLNQYGEGLTLNNALDSVAGSPTEGQFIVTGGSLAGNPELDPWRSTNYDLSVEWYTGAASMVSAAIFRVEIDSFTVSETVDMEMPDADGVVRRSVPINTLVQGEGGTLEGFEAGAKLAFSDFVDSGNLLASFGVDTNFTYSPSEGSGTDIYGEENMFNDNSERQFNMIGWYQGDRFEARIAYNYRSERLAGQGGWGALNLYQASTAYVDISASYDIDDNFTVYAQGSNITGEYEDYYLQWQDQYAFQNYYETRYIMGVRAKF